MRAPGENAAVQLALEVRMDTWQEYAAELLGTFVLVFVGTTAIVASVGTGLTLVAVAFAFGLALLAGLYAFGEVSGGHYNPAVSLAMFLDGRMSSADLFRYWIAQFAGGILASLVLLIATSRLAVKATATVPGIEGDGSAFLMEVVLTAIFVLVILQVSVSERFGGSALLAIPLTLVAVHLAAIPISGASVNPARSFGPDLVGWRWTGIWIYLIGPAVGAVIAVAIHRYLRTAAAFAEPEAPAAEVLGEPERPL
jgi:aquaporin Z